jgi:hypothetical protein
MDLSFYTVPVAVQQGSAATVRSCALYSRAALLAAHHPRGVPGSPIGETLICRTLGRDRMRRLSRGPGGHTLLPHIAPERKIV